MAGFCVLNEKKLITAGIALATIAAPATVYAGSEVRQAVQPIISALQDLAEPVSYAFMIYGGIRYMSGASNEGKRILRDAIAGYVLIQWIPFLFKLVSSIKPGV